MIELEDYYYANMREFFSSEGDLLEIISAFSCPQNEDVERFLKVSSIEFTKKNQSVSYLVFSKEIQQLVGYFTIAIKPLTIGAADVVSNTQKRKIERICRLDESSQSYTMSAYLIAQLGKNFSRGANEKITGDYLLSIALNVVDKLQYSAGGMVSFVETDNNDKLLSFYQRNKFHLISSPQKNNNELVQLFRII